MCTFTKCNNVIGGSDETCNCNSSVTAVCKVFQFYEVDTVFYLTISVSRAD